MNARDEVSDSEGRVARTDSDMQEKNGDSVLSTTGITRKFGELVAVDHVDLTLKSGELRSIIGPNGAGKTTLFNMIAGTLPATEGEVRFQGEPVTELPPEERAQRGLSRAYQSIELFNDLSVFENIRIAAQTASAGSFTLDFLSRSEGIEHGRTQEVLELVNLSGESSTTAKNLSHGDKRRLGIGIALATDPSVLLLDEPTSGMGPEATQRTAELIEHIRETLDITILLIEHDMSVVLSISDRISVLHRGSLLTTGTPEDVRGNEAVQEAYLGGLKGGGGTE